MKRTMTTLGAFMLMATPVLASSGSETGSASLLVTIFLGFGALIVIGQLMPGLILFFSMLKGLLEKTVKKPVVHS